MPNPQIETAAHLRRTENLERRAPSLSLPEPALGCCIEYCCTDIVGISKATGEIADLCVTDIDPIGGNGLRLRMTGWVNVVAHATGPFGLIVWYDIDGSTYLGRPRWIQNSIHDLDEITIPFGNTIDVAVPDPTVKVRVQNLSTVSWTIGQVYSSIIVSERSGSQACGALKTGTGP